MNIITLTDSYKVSHYKQYPPGTTRLFSFYESRGGLFPLVTFFGLQYFLKKYLVGPVVHLNAIDQAAELFSRHFGDSKLFNARGWIHILRNHNGRLPVRICAVPEGTTLPYHNVMMTVENTDPEVPWLTNYLETLLCQIWYPCTVATQSRAMRGMVLKFLEKTGDPALIDFKVHDFGYRGSTSVESAGIGAAAHLLSFKGTDTMAGLEVASEFYGEPCAGFSIPAAEHSTITSWGREHEEDAFENMLTAFPTGLVAVVSDSYDVFYACSHLWGDKLKDKVLARDGGLVVRPDSGYPPDVVLQVLNILGAAFGYTINDKGFKVLNPKVRVIQGDGIDHDMIGRVLDKIISEHWSADNVAFGSGGGLLQKVNRDTLKFAFKASAVKINGEWHDVMKNPVTDPGKKSKAGRLALIQWPNGDYETMTEDKAQDAVENGNAKSLLVPVFENGQVLKTYTFSDIRQRMLKASEKPVEVV